MAATVPAPCSARPRLHPPRAAVRARQSTGPRRSPVSAAAAAAPRGGGDSSSSLNPSRDSSSRKTTTTASAAASLDFATSCPWPRPPSYQEPVEKRRSIGSRVALVVAKIMNGDTGALPPAVARLGGAFTDGCAVEGLEEGSSVGVGGGGQSSSSSSSSSPLLRAAARFWRYQGMR